LKTPCGEVDTDWETKTDTGRAVASSRKDPQGFRHEADHDARNRTTEVRQVQRPSTDLQPTVGLENGPVVVVGTYDERWGIPKTMEVPRIDGRGLVSSTVTVNERGRITGGSIGNISWT